MKQDITIRQIAKMAGVNASTVSRVFNPDCGHSISDQIKDKIMAIADKHKYVPKSSARSLASGKSFKLGVILNDLEGDMSSPTLSEIFGEFCREAMKYGYQVLMLPTKPDNIDHEVVKNIRSGNADAYWIGASLMGSETMLELENKQIPVVAYVSDTNHQKPLPNVTTVHVDNTIGFQELFQKLKDRGFSSFLEIMPKSYATKYLRSNFYSNGADYGIISEKSIELNTAKSNLLLRHETQNFALENIEVLKKHELIICHNDLIALGICDAMRLHGIEPGRDISVIGYDNIEENRSYGSLEKPFLTTIAKDNTETGRKMVKYLLDMINKKESQKHINIPTRCIIRDSLGFGKNYKTSKQIIK